MCDTTLPRRCDAMIGKDHLKGFLADSTRRLPASVSRQLSTLVGYVSLGAWLREHDFGTGKLYADKWCIFASVAATIGNTQVQYCEFGVFKGESLRRWSHLLTNPESRLHGFDSFQGLPETWRSDYRVGAFSTDGVMPEIDD